MGEQSLWQFVGAIIMSVGGAGAIICAVIGFFSQRIANYFDSKYEHKLNLELEKIKGKLEHCRYVTKNQFDKEFDVYRLLSKTFFNAIVKLDSFTEGTLELQSETKECLLDKASEFVKMGIVIAEAQNTLYENAAFIPKDIFEGYDDLYEKINQLFWSYEDRIKKFSLKQIDYKALVIEDDKCNVNNIKEEYKEINASLREYLETLSIVN